MTDSPGYVEETGKSVIKQHPKVLKPDHTGILSLRQMMGSRIPVILSHDKITDT